MTVNKVQQVTLTKPAKKKGGDRYESQDGFTIYIPQDISRPKGVPVQKLTITFKEG